MKSLLESKNKKGQFTINMLQIFAIVIATTAIILSITGEVLDDVQSEVTDSDLYSCTNGSAAYNATCGGLEATNTFADWLDTIALVLVAVIVIGLVAFFGRSTRGR